MVVRDGGLPRWLGWFGLITAGHFGTSHQRDLYSLHAFCLLANRGQCRSDPGCGKSGNSGKRIVKGVSHLLIDHQRQQQLARATKKSTN